MYLGVAFVDCRPPLLYLYAGSFCPFAGEGGVSCQRNDRLYYSARVLLCIHLKKETISENIMARIFSPSSCLTVLQLMRTKCSMSINTGHVPLLLS